MTRPKLISREEVLGGMPGRAAKQANTLLALIESRTAYLMVQSQQVATFVLTEATAQAPQRAFLEAIAQGRDLPIQPTIQDLERYASQWAILIPANPDIRANVAHLLGQKYEFAAQTAPGLRAAMGLDTAAVQQAYQRLYDQLLTTIYAPQVKPLDRVRWAWARWAGWLDALPPFWVAFLISLIVGAVTLALPIAVAGVGTLPGIAFIILFGLINMATIAAMAEAATRSAQVRYGGAFIGQMVANYLGQTSSIILTLALVIFSFGMLLTFYLGLASTLADLVGAPVELWVGLLFLASLFFVSRRTTQATVASALLVSVICVGLLLILALLALPHLSWQNLTALPQSWLKGPPFDLSPMGPLIGIILGAYAAHTAVPAFAWLLLQRDPGGRSVLHGHAAGVGFAMLVNVGWVVIMNGAIPAQILARQPGTVLIPLTDIVGGVAPVFGLILVILSLGLGLVYFSLGLFHLVRERLPAHHALLGARQRFLLCLTPIIAVFLLAEWQTITQTGSFTSILGFVGLITNTLLAGIFPMLLLVAARRKGELLPGQVYHFLGHPALVITLYLFFLLILGLHGLVIWQNPIEQVGALFTAGLVVGATLIMARQGAFGRRLVVEVRIETKNPKQANEEREAEMSGSFNIVMGGQATPADIQLTYADHSQSLQAATGQIPHLAELRSLQVQLPPTRATELKIWTHRLTLEGASVGLTGLLEVQCGPETKQFELNQTGPGKQVVLPLTPEPCQITMILAKETK